MKISQILKKLINTENYNSKWKINIKFANESKQIVKS